ncbi:MAG: M42 family peptidase [Balneolaceae bacterium]|nr:MAG: M42 family peptidase [Balneolaceae bacterium]
MFDKETQEFLENLIITPSPTGYEAQGQKVWKNYVSAYADKVESDAYGSALARIDVNSVLPAIMIEAHADEIGMVVQHISDNGFITLNRIGGSDSTIARAKKVYILNKRGRVTGVTGNTAIHLQETKNGGGKQPAWKDIFVDIGVSSKEEALEMVQVGDPVIFTDEIDYLNDELITGRALDNRIGSFILAQVLKNLKKRRSELRVNVLALNSVQEEVGGFGARMMSYRYMPDAAIVTDVTHATDTPGIDNKEHGTVNLGKGPAIQHGGANHVAVVRLIEETAEKHKIEIQHEATSIRTGTDTDSIFYQQTGIPSALISLPLRYMHSPVETVSIKDIEALITLMTETVLAMEADHHFTVFE